MAVELLPKLLPNVLFRNGGKTIADIVGLFKFRPADPIPTGAVFTGPAGRTYHDVAGALQTAALNTRRDAHYVNGKRVMLLEGAATNLALQSQALENAAWSVLRATVSPNAIAAPDGTVTADKVVEDATAAATHLVFSTADIAVVTASVYTTTVYAKAGERSWFQLAEGQGVTAGAYFDLANGVIGTVSGTGSPSATIVPLGNGWYRCSLTFTTVGVVARIRCFLASGDGGTTYTGNGASGLYVWGAQMELGASSTSYIPTVAATVTRTAEAETFPAVARSGTYYERWLSPSGVVTDAVSVYTSPNTIPLTTNRGYTNIKVATGTRSLAEMRSY